MEMQLYGLNYRKKETEIKRDTETTAMYGDNSNHGDGEEDGSNNGDGDGDQLSERDNKHMCMKYQVFLTCFQFSSVHLTK